MYNKVPREYFIGAKIKFWETFWRFKFGFNFQCCRTVH